MGVDTGADVSEDNAQQLRRGRAGSERVDGVGRVGSVCHASARSQRVGEVLVVEGVSVMSHPVPLGLWVCVLDGDVAQCVLRGDVWYSLSVAIKPVRGCWFLEFAFWD